MARDSDMASLEVPRLKITREVPMWGILTVLGSLACQAIALYYGQQSMAAEMSRLSSTLAEIKLDQKALAAELRRNAESTTELKYQQAGLEQRVRLLESAQSAPPPRR